MSYFLFVTDDRENTFLYEFESLEDAEDKMNELDSHDYAYEYQLIHGERV